MIKDMHFLALCNSCSRLGLVSLSYLWRREQAELLKEMIDNGVTAIVIKVASMGKYIAAFSVALYLWHSMFIHVCQ